jgi:hypothetical protein
MRTSVQPHEGSQNISAKVCISLNVDSGQAGRIRLLVSLEINTRSIAIHIYVKRLAVLSSQTGAEQE